MACLFTKTNPDTVASPFVRGNGAEVKENMYPTTAKATYTTTEAHVHRFSTGVSCKKLHQLSQSSKVRILAAHVPPGRQ